MVEYLLQILGNSTLITLATGGAFFCGAWLLFSIIERGFRAHHAASDEIIVTETRSPVIRMCLPTARLLGAIVKSLAHGSSATLWTTFRSRVDRALISAGRPEGLDAEEFIGIGVLSCIFWAVFLLLFPMLLMPENFLSTETLACAFFGGIFGIVSWRSWLTTQKTQRAVSIQRQLPFALDLLTLAMEAGMDFTSALTRICSKTGNTPLGAEFSLMLHEIQLGKTRSDALRDLANRCDLQDLRTVVASLVQAEELGSSLGSVLRIQAAQQRERRSQRAEEKAMKAPIKMMFPMIFILGALAAVMIGPIVIAYLKTFY